MAIDRASIVARAVVDLLATTIRTGEFPKQLEQLLRDEFADERREAAADRELPDA
jgi:hypothetical protein